MIVHHWRNYWSPVSLVTNRRSYFPSFFSDKQTCRQWTFLLINIRSYLFIGVREKLWAHWYIVSEVGRAFDISSCKFIPRSSIIALLFVLLLTLLLSNLKLFIPAWTHLFSLHSFQGIRDIVHSYLCHQICPQFDRVSGTLVMSWYLNRDGSMTIYVLKMSQDSRGV